MFGSRERGSVFKRTLGLVVAAIVVVGVVVTVRHNREPRRASHSRNILGVTARFVIETPKVTRGQSVKMAAIYRNATPQTVSFRVWPPSYDAEFWLGNVDKTGCVIPATPPVEDLVLAPGQEYRIEDELPLGACYEPGTYDVRFSYNSWFLPADIRSKFLQQAGGEKTTIPWEDGGHRLVIR